MADDQFGIPSEIYPSDTGNNGTIDNPVKMDTSGRVNFAIDVIKSMLAVQGWSLEPELAHNTFFFDLPVSDRTSAIGSLIIRCFDPFGGFFAYQVFDVATELDPSGGTVTTDLGDGHSTTAVIRGIGVTSGMSQNAIIGALVAQMNADANPYFSVTAGDPINDPGSSLDGVYTSLTIVAQHDAAVTFGPYLNDRVNVGNLLGGGTFTSTKGGGWAMTSRQANDCTPLRVSLTNTDTSNLTIRATFLNGAHCDVSTALAPTVLARCVLHKRDNYIIIAGPYQLIIYPESYKTYVADNIVEVLEGTSDYWLCAPFVPDKYRFVPTDPTVTGIPYAAFQAMSPRTQLNALQVANCVADRFVEKNFAPVLDCGMSIYVVNTNLHDDRPLLTTTQIGLIVSPIVGLSPGLSLFDREHHNPYVNQPLSIVGYIWDAYTTTYYAAPNTVQTGKDGRKYVAYRQQYEPCECTLWISFA